MATEPTLGDLRNGIQDVWRELAAERAGHEVSNSDVLQRVMSRMGEDVAALAPELVQMALVKLLNDLSGRRRAPRTPSGQGDLFSGYDVPRLLSVGRGKKKEVASLTVTEARLYLESRSRSAEGSSGTVRGLLNDCLPYRRSDDETLGDLMERRLQAENAHPC